MKILNQEIQILRGIAITLVLFLHSQIIFTGQLLEQHIQITKTFRTSSGVDLLFVLAGFFLAKYTFSLEQHNTISEKVSSLFIFYKKKFCRLAPNAYLWAFVVLVCGYCLRHNPYFTLDQATMLKKFFATVMWVRNFEEQYSQTSFGYFWAISLEMQVFLIFPAIYLILGKNKTILLSLLLCVGMGFYRFGIPDERVWMFRFDGILWGCLVYFLLSEILPIEKIKAIFPRNRLISLLLILSIASVLAVLASMRGMSYTVASLLSCIALILALANNGFFLTNIKIIDRTLTWIGDRSYSFFCCHTPSWIISLHLIRKIEMSEYIRPIIPIVFMLLCAELSYRFVEKRFIAK